MGIEKFTYVMQVNSIDFDTDTVTTEEYEFDSLDQISRHMRCCDLSYANSINIRRDTTIVEV